VEEEEIKMTKILLKLWISGN